MSLDPQTLEEWCLMWRSRYLRSKAPNAPVQDETDSVPAAQVNPVLPDPVALTAMPIEPVVYNPPDLSATDQQIVTDTAGRP